MPPARVAPYRLPLHRKSARDVVLASAAHNRDICPPRYRSGVRSCAAQSLPDIARPRTETLCRRSRNAYTAPAEGRECFDRHATGRGGRPAGHSYGRVYVLGASAWPSLGLGNGVRPGACRPAGQLPVLCADGRFPAGAVLSPVAAFRSAAAGLRCTAAGLRSVDGLDPVLACRRTRWFPAAVDELVGPQLLSSTIL